jgi:predicted permease
MRIETFDRTNRFCRSCGRVLQDLCRSLYSFFLIRLPCSIRSSFFVFPFPMHALRSLLKAPSFTVIAVLTLALGIGENTAIVGVIDATLLRPLPLPEPDRLVRIAGDHPQRFVYFGPGGFHVWPSLLRARAFTAVGAYFSGQMALGIDSTGRAEVTLVTPEFFDVLRVKPLLGRVFTRDDVSVSPHIALISHQLWQSAFAGDRAVLSRSVVLNSQSFLVVGVMPPQIQVPASTTVWIPNGSARFRDGRVTAPIVIGRLAGGATPAHALEEVRAARSVSFSRGEVVDSDQPSRGNLDARLIPLRRALAGDAVPVLLVVAAGSLLLFIVACANASGLLLTRLSSKHRDLAVRRALGASDRDLRRHILGEGAIVLLLAAALSLPLTMWTFHLTRAIVPPPLSAIGVSELFVDARVIAVALTFSLAACLLFTAVPVVWARRGISTDVLRNTSAVVTTDVFWRRVRSGFVVAEIAFALVLLAGAVMVVRTVGRLMTVDLGVRGERTLIGQLDFPSETARVPQSARLLLDRIDTAIRAIPGVENLAFTTSIPGDAVSVRSAQLLVDGAPLPTKREYLGRDVRVSPAYFATIGIDLLAGRAFDQRDHFFAPKVAIVSETYVRRYSMQPAEVVGRGAVLDRRRVQIVGVVRDVRMAGPESDLDAAAYIPIAQSLESGAMSLVVRTTREPGQYATQLRTAVARVAPTLPLYHVRTFEQVRDAHVRDRRFVMLMMSAFAALAIALAALGLSGAVSYLVQLRTREIGIRMAMGATRRAVSVAVLRSGLAHAVVGIGVGAALALAASRIISTHVRNLGQIDVGTLSIVAVLLLSVAFVAAWFPAQRAARVDPIIALRCD